MGRVEMSERELRRAEVLASVLAGRLTVSAAAGLMGITVGQPSSAQLSSRVSPAISSFNWRSPFIASGLFRTRPRCTCDLSANGSTL